MTRPNWQKEHEEAYGDEHDPECPLCGVDTQMTRPESLTLFIPGIPSNTNRSGHMGSGKWMPIKERATFRGKTAGIAQFEAGQAGWTPWEYTLVMARHISPVRRRRDPLGLAERLKPIMDGLVDAGIIPDDDEKHIEVHLLPSRKGPEAGILLNLFGVDDSSE